MFRAGGSWPSKEWQKIGGSCVFAHPSSRGCWCSVSQGKKVFSCLSIPWWGCIGLAAASNRHPFTCKHVQVLPGKGGVENTPSLHEASLGEEGKAWPHLLPLCHRCLRAKGSMAEHYWGRGRKWVIFSISSARDITPWRTLPMGRLLHRHPISKGFVDETSLGGSREVKMDLSVLSQEHFSPRPEFACQPTQNLICVHHCTQTQFWDWDHGGKQASRAKTSQVPKSLGTVVLQGARPISMLD